MKNKQNSAATRCELRNFGLLVGIVFGLIAAWPLFSHQPVRVWVATFAGLLIAPALLRPQLLRLPYAFWQTIGAAMGWFNTRVILTILYFGAVLPTGLLLRLIGKSPLKLHFDKKTNTYRELPEPDSDGSITEQF